MDLVHRVYRRVCKEVASITETPDGRLQVHGDDSDAEQDGPIVVEEVRMLLCLSCISS